MEHTFIDIVGLLGLDFILIATLVLFAGHAIETWQSRSRQVDSSRESVDAVEHRVPQLTQAQHAATGEHDEEPARRAA